MRVKKFTKVVAIYCLIQFTVQTFLPTISYALTSGPTQPEFSSFEPVASTNMVDEFTGDFTYNLPIIEVPGPHGSSYPLSLSYHSGVTPEEEASWVGYGWTLNSGAITRTVQGVPDDHKGSPITFYNKTPKNWTVVANASLILETLTKEKKKGLFSASISASYRYNNYRGFGVTKGIGVNFAGGLVSMGYTVSQGEGSFSLNVNPNRILNLPWGRHNKKAQEKTGEGNTNSGEQKENNNSANKEEQKKVHPLTILTGTTGSSYGIFTTQQVLPTQVQSFSGKYVSLSVAPHITPGPPPIGLGFNVMGSYAFQSNLTVTRNAYGYLYAGSSEETDITDYHIDRENPLDKQDELLGIPFNTPDQFMATGEGINGGFKLYHNSIGHFGPGRITSTQEISNVSVELQTGPLNIGPGSSLGGGLYTLESTDWFKDGVNSKFNEFPASSGDEGILFRFNNDMGGNWGELERFSDKATRFGITPGKLPKSNINFVVNEDGQSGRSSYIGFHTNEQMISSNAFYNYSKRDELNTMANRGNPRFLNCIGELSVTNEDGLQYIYALPVYSQHEATMSYGVRGISMNNIDNNYLVYDKRNDIEVGQKKDDPYANTYLLTEITTQDYIDKTNNGPTLDDFGGYVRFSYNKIFGENASGGWYRWRTPYNGLIYQRNLLSERKDDMGTMLSGEKEIYYLKAIETKTHVAFFTLEDRFDGHGAADNLSAIVKGAKSTDHPLKRLKKIDLYALNSFVITRDEMGDIVRPSATVKPIKTIHFKYKSQSEELMKGAPNAFDPYVPASDPSSPTGNPDLYRGRLTLDKVYFEYNGVSTSKISPYIFHYKYPTVSYPTTPSTDYSLFADYSYNVRTKSHWQEPANGGSAGNPIDPENPPYSPFNLDAWGNYQPFGKDQYKNMRTWVDQSLIPNEDFDPAPWHLKRIVLPSGGEIHVQYEQDDYQFVQDQEAHLMINISERAENKYYLNLSAMNIAPSDLSALEKLKMLINRRYVNTKKKMYFKMLYALKGFGADIANCNSEYITGYSKVLHSDYEPIGGGQYKFFVELGGGETPYKICKDFVYSHAIGKVDDIGNCDTPSEMLDSRDNPIQILNAFVSASKTFLSHYDADEYCISQPNLPFSYLRVPAVYPKKGGGVRVKRLLTYDNSLDGPVLYGNEYDYSIIEDGLLRSSGVATNEPLSNREENILVDYLAKKQQKWINKIVAGEDKEISEGPIGESIYPGPSVGYSQVRVTNIYTGKTNPGYRLTKFFTAKDYPIKTERTDLHRIGGKPKIDFKFFVNKFYNHNWATQGYSFILNNMHGQILSSATYSGESELVTEQSYQYFEPGEKVPVMSKLYGEIKLKSLGREVDITLGQKKVSEKSVDKTVAFDFTVGIAGIIPWPFYFTAPTITKYEAEVNTHVTTKVIRYPAIVKRVTTFQNGIYHSDEYLAFDGYTGSPVVVRSKDEFKGAYLVQDVPAGWEYNNFTQKAINENKTYNASAYSLNFNDEQNGTYTLQFGGAQGCKAITEMATGDLLKFEDGQSLFHVSSVDYGASKLTLVKSGLLSGSNPSGAVHKFTVVRSGRNNQLNQKAGNIVFHDPDANAINTESLVQEESRYVSTTFTQDLTTSFNSDFVSPLAGPYTNMNMLAYQYIASSCAADWEHATVKDLKFKKEIDPDGHVKVSLIEFYIDCGSGSYVLIKL